MIRGGKRDTKGVESESTIAKPYRKTSKRARQKESAERGKHVKQNHKKESNKRRLKPYSKMTWQEKRDLEIRDDIREKEREDRQKKQRKIRRTSGRKVGRGICEQDYRPSAPRNTTQDLMELHCKANAEVDDDMDFDGETLNNMGSMGCDEDRSDSELSPLGRSLDHESDCTRNGRRKSNTKMGHVETRLKRMEALLTEKDLEILRLRKRISELESKALVDHAT